MMHMKKNWLLNALLISAILNSCGNQELTQLQSSEQRPVTHKESIDGKSPTHPERDVRSHFIGETKPLLDENSLVQLWAGSQKSDKPKMLIKELYYPTLEYALDGTLYFIGDHQDAIVGIFPDGSSKVIVRSGVMGYVTPDGGIQPEPLRNTFEELSVAPNGNLLTLRDGVYPVKVDVSSGDSSFLSFILPSGNKIEEAGNYELFYKAYSFETLPYTASIQSDIDNTIVIAAGDKKASTWFRYREGEVIETIRNPLHLPIDAYMIDRKQWEQHFLDYVSGPDGYIYAVEQGKGNQDPDRVIRIGDSGMSSLRKDASRVVIAQFKHGELTGSIAFSPSGALAVGAKNRIYLITPGPAGEPQHGRLP